MRLTSLILITSTYALHPAVITETTTPKDVARFEVCHRIDAEQVNTFLSPGHCQAFTALCLDQFDLSGLSGACKDRLRLSELKKLGSGKFKELLATEDLMNVGCMPKAFKLFYDKVVDALPDAYVKVCRHDDAWLRVFAGKLSYEGQDLGITEIHTSKRLTWFLENPEYVKGLSPNFFDYLRPRLMYGLSGPSIRNMSPEQFSRIKIRLNTKEQLGAIPPENMSSFPRPFLIFQTPTQALNALTPEQARNWGTDPKDLPRKGRFKRRAFYANHPCLYLRAMLRRFKDPDVVKAIEGRCSPLWSQRDFPRMDLRHRHNVYHHKVI